MTQHFPSELNLIAELQIHSDPEIGEWQVVVVQTDGFVYSYPDRYLDVNAAFDKARVLHHYCQHPVKITIMSADGEAVAVQCEKLTKLDILARSQHIYIYFNGRLKGWEMLVTEGDIKYIQGGLESEKKAVELANFITKLNPECVVARDIPDNTCRARGCAWNMEDSCFLLPRSSLLPPESVDMTVDEWTVDNHPTPRSCLNYKRLKA